MTYLWIPIGLILPTFSGWCALRLLEGRTSVLFAGERIVAGLCIGIVLTMFVTFLATITGLIPLTLVGMGSVQILCALALGAPWFIRRSSFPKSPKRSHEPLVLWQKILIGIFSLWMISKLIAGFIFLIGPPYYDDVMNNWNLRGKAFFAQQQLVLELEPGKSNGVHSYPQAVPLIKTWFANLNGQWHEGLVNSIHIIWYVCILLLIFYALRRLLSLPWSLLGIYMLGSIPLFSMHGMIAYTDLYLSLLIFLSVSFLFFAVRNSGEQRLSFLRIGALATGVLVYTKNEALLLHVPPIVFLLLLSLWFAKFSRNEIRTAIQWYTLCIATFLVPWLLFKWHFGLSFGNAKSISGFSLEWHEGVLQTIAANTLFEGNWNLLPVLFVGVCFAKWRSILWSPLSIIFGFIFAVWLGQLPIYMFTPLYTEALNQTGYARGLIHIAPLVVFGTILLLANILHRKTGQDSV